MTAMAATKLKRQTRKKVPRRARFEFAKEVRWLNHRSFRFPAKFHPPVARALVEQFSQAGDLVLDPFSGSGTLLVEAIAAGRNCIGYDVDPLAVMVTQAKTQRYDMAFLEECAEEFCDDLVALRLADLRRDGSMLEDISSLAYRRRLAALNEWIPDIPRFEHWFRYRVMLQLAMIRQLLNLNVAEELRPFFDLCFAAIIRNASNADPVPVSGLEVTSHMLRLEKAGRTIDPFDLMIKVVRRNLDGVHELDSARRSKPRALVARRDASTVWLENVPKADVVITSPPYLSAVDYYRRHTLEMYWLGLVEGPDERLELLPRYIGRAMPAQRSIQEDRAATSGTERRWLRRLGRESPKRVRALQHYAGAMEAAIANQSRALKKNGRLVIVVGDSRIDGRPFPTATLLEELAAPHFQTEERLWYPIRNRYMSYERHNGASIAKEWVLVMRRR